MFLGLSHTQKRYKCYCLKLNRLIIYVDVTFLESKQYFDTKSHSSESDEDFFYFLVQERLVDNIASLDITDQDTLPPKYREPTKVCTRHNSTVSPPPSIPVSISQSSEDTLPSSDVTPIPVLSDPSSDILPSDCSSKG